MSGKTKQNKTKQTNKTTNKLTSSLFFVNYVINHCSDWSKGEGCKPVLGRAAIIERTENCDGRNAVVS